MNYDGGLAFRWQWRPEGKRVVFRDDGSALPASQLGVDGGGSSTGVGDVGRPEDLLVDNNETTSWCSPDAGSVGGEQLQMSKGDGRVIPSPRLDGGSLTPGCGCARGEGGACDPCSVESAGGGACFPSEEAQSGADDGGGECNEIRAGSTGGTTPAAALDLPTSSSSIRIGGSVGLVARKRGRTQLESAGDEYVQRSPGHNSHQGVGGPNNGGRKRRLGIVVCGGRDSSTCKFFSCGLLYPHFGRRGPTAMGLPSLGPGCYDRGEHERFAGISVDNRARPRVPPASKA